MDFDRNDRIAIEAALQDSNPKNPIAVAVAERIRDFLSNLTEMAERNGHFPTELLLKRPETAFDEIVIRLTLETVADELGHIVTICWVPRDP